jgi:DNA-binding transcriptional ArsR family regulator
MLDSEEETYATIFTALKHPIRRGILRILSAAPKSFSDLQKVFKIESSHLTYHLEGLGNLLLKTEDGKYALSSLGEAAVSMMNHVEEPRKAPLHLLFPSKKWKFLAATMTIGLIAFSALFCFEYQKSNQLSTQFSNLSELLEKFFPEALNLRDADLTYKYTVNDTVKTALADNETHSFADNGSGVIGLYSVTFTLDHFKVYSVYSLTNNATLEIEISFDGPGRPQDYLYLAVSKEVVTPTVGYVGSIVDRTEPWSLNASQPIVSPSFSYEPILTMKATGSGKYLVDLPSGGRYFILVEAPAELNATDPHAIGYRLTLQIRDQRDYLPFFVGGSQGGFTPAIFGP